MTLTVQECQQHIRHTLGGEPSTELQPIAILNEAGKYLVTMQDWRWLERPQRYLDLRGNVSFSTGSSPTASAVLTVSGASSYTHLDGDYVQLTGGTGVTAGYYQIVSQSGTALTLDRTIQSSGSTVTNIAGTVFAHACALPDDFRTLLWVVPAGGLLFDFTIVDISDLMGMRMNSAEVGSRRYFGAITHGRDLTSDGAPPTPRLEIYPSLTSNETGGLVLAYKAGWANITSDSQLVPIPEYCETLFVQLVRAFARGYEEEDSASLDQRLGALHRGVIFRVAKDRDGEVIANLGQMGGGAARTTLSSAPRWITTTIGGP